MPTVRHVPVPHRNLLLTVCASGLVATACAHQLDSNEPSRNIASGGASVSLTATATGGTSDSGVGGYVQSGVGGTATGGSPSTGTDCPTPEEDKFSFFLTSQFALQNISGSPDGFGGDLGGLEGADAICQHIAETSSACQQHKTWHAFLSTPTVNAKDRIGTGPWYDRLGHLLATNLANLLTERPGGTDSTIVNDFPNEYGVPNHDSDGTGQVDNHEILTGTGTDGNVYRQSTTRGGGFPGGGSVPGDSTSCGPGNEIWTIEAATCWGWTTSEGKGCPRVGHSWPRDISGKHRISVFNEGGCAPGGQLDEPGDVPVGLDGTPRVGSAGGYGGFYCFALHE